MYFDSKEDNSYADGSDGIQIAKDILSFLPITGTAIDIYDAINNPNLSTIGQAGLSLAADLSGAWLLKGLAKTAKRVNRLQKIANKTKKIEDRTAATIAQHQYDVDKYMKPVKATGIQLFDGIINTDDKIK